MSWHEPEGCQFHCLRRLNRPLSLSDRGGDKPDAFSLPPLSAASVDAPLIDECNANFECRRANTQLVNRYKSFVLEVIEALIDRARRNWRALHSRTRRNLAAVVRTIEIRGRLTG